MYFPIGTEMLVLFNKFTQTMASVYLFEPGNIDAPQLSVEQIESTYGPINLYSFYSDSFWAGFDILVRALTICSKALDFNKMQLLASSQAWLDT